MSISQEIKQNLLEATVNLLPGGLMILDENARIVLWNDWLVEKTSINAETAIDSELSSLYPNEHFKRFRLALDFIFDFQLPQVLSHSLNQYLLPIPVQEGKFKNIDHMQQDVQLIPISFKEKTYALVLITDVTALYYERMGFLSVTQKTKIQSYTDPLTGAYNKRFLTDWLKDAIHSAFGQDKAIICYSMDLDKFKAINDTYGHDIGDEILLAFAESINDMRRTSDYLIRMGGDEFILFQIIDDFRSAIPHHFAKRLLNHFGKERFTKHDIQISCSCGISVWDRADNPVPGKALLKQADEALYAAKNEGRNTYSIYDSEHQ